MYCIEIFIVVVFWIKFGWIYGLIAVVCGLLDIIARWND